MNDYLTAQCTTTLQYWMNDSVRYCTVAVCARASTLCMEYEKVDLTTALIRLFEELCKVFSYRKDESALLKGEYSLIQKAMLSINISV
jgi:hypothetical protein